jgi:RimJ/RimL family protein N-acetyltransferase
MQVFLETERLLLRRFTEDDLENLVELDSDPEVMRFITGGRATPREEVENEILPAFLDHYERYAGYGFWATVEKSTEDSSVGSTSVRPRELQPAKSSSATAYADPPGAGVTPPKARER